MSLILEDFYLDETFVDPVNGKTYPDYSPAFERAHATFLKGIVGDVNKDKRRFKTDAERILFGSSTKEYHFSRTIDCFGVHIYAERVGVICYVHTTGPAVRLHCPKIVGLPATGPDYLDMPGGSHPSGYGGKTWISQITFDGMGRASHGILASIRCDLNDVMVDDINGPGIMISADVNRPERSNANDCRLVGCVAQSCKGDGFSWFGGDANSGYTINCRAQYCTGWGFNDSSFFGNAHYSPRAVLCGTAPVFKDATDRVVTGPTDPTAVQPVVQDPNTGWKAYKTDSGNQRSIFVQPYVEGPEALIDVKPYSLVLGGSGGLLSPLTTAIKGRQVKGQMEMHAVSGRVRFGLTDAIFDIEPWMPGATSGSHPITFQTDVSGRLDVELGRVNALRYMSYLTSVSALGSDKRTAGKIAFDQGFYEGQCLNLAPSPGLTPPDLGTIPNAAQGMTWRTSTPQRGQPYEWVTVKKPDNTLEWVVVVTLPV